MQTKMVTVLRHVHNILVPRFSEVISVEESGFDFLFGALFP